MGTSIEQQMIELYCFVDEFLKQHPALAHWRHSPHAQPRFSDAEVLTIALLQGVLEVATLKEATSRSPTHVGALFWLAFS